MDALPGSSAISKTAILSSGAGLSAYAISNEFYVMNEETVVAFCLLSVFYGIFAYGGPMYSEWAAGQVKRVRDILDTAKKGHADAIKVRIEDVKPLNNVVEITKGLFDVSKVSSDIVGQWQGRIADGTYRRLQSLKPKHSSLSRRLLLLRKPRLCSTPGSDTRVKSNSDNRKNWLTQSSPRSRKSWRTPKCYNRSWPRLLRMSRKW